MKLSTKARYAIQCMVGIARSSGTDKPVSLKKIADRTHLSRSYLEQLAIPLKRAALIRGVSGRSGGYFLSRPAKEIRIGQIVEATIGAISIVDCVRDPDACLRSDCCECRHLYDLVNDRIRQAFYGFTLEDIAFGSQELPTSGEDILVTERAV